MHSNSLAAHRANRYTDRHKAIIRDILDHGPGTDRKIKERLGLDDMNQVRPRISELIEMGVLEETGEAVCNVTGKTVRVVGFARSETHKAFDGMAFVHAHAAKQLTLGI